MYMVIAETWGQNPAMVTGFTDGSKINFEEAIVSLCDRFVVKSRGICNCPLVIGDKLRCSWSDLLSPRHTVDCCAVKGNLPSSRYVGQD
jgi:hypothetical protein